MLPDRSVSSAGGATEVLREPSLSRRTFLSAGAAAGGGLLLSVSLPALTRNADAADTGTFAPNAFVRIGRDGQVTLIMHKVEMGQGTYTSMPMLLAEELEVDLSQIRLEHAPPSDELYAEPLFGVQRRAARPRCAAIGSHCAALAPPRACCWSPPRRRHGRSTRTPARLRGAR